jgi:UDP-N-acetylglucosamine 2-epimerase
LKETSNILAKDKSKTRVDGSKNPYGGGNANKRILEQIKSFFAK